MMLHFFSGRRLRCKLAAKTWREPLRQLNLVSAPARQSFSSNGSSMNQAHKPLDEARDKMRAAISAPVGAALTGRGVVGWRCAPRP